MPLVNQVVIQVTKSDRVYNFTMPMGCPLGEVYDACHEILQEIVVHSKNAADNAKRIETPCDINN
jgi:hypothetical protein